MSESTTLPAGTHVIISFLSGAYIWDFKTTNCYNKDVLAQKLLEAVARREHVPQHCLTLVWRLRPSRADVTCILNTVEPDPKFEVFHCEICGDPCGCAMEESTWSLNCVRCKPSWLCKECHVQMPDRTWCCFDCISEPELHVLQDSPNRLRRFRLVRADWFADP